MDSVGALTVRSMRASAALMATTTSPFRMGMTPGAIPSADGATLTPGMADGPAMGPVGATTPGVEATGDRPTSDTGAEATTLITATSAPMAIPVGAASVARATWSTALLSRPRGRGSSFGQFTGLSGANASGDDNTGSASPNTGIKPDATRGTINRERRGTRGTTVIPPAPQPSRDYDYGRQSPDRTGEPATQPSQNRSNRNSGAAPTVDGAPPPPPGNTAARAHRAVQETGEAAISVAPFAPAECTPSVFRPLWPRRLILT